MVEQTTTTTTHLAGGITLTKVTVVDLDGIESGFVIDSHDEPLTPQEAIAFAAQLTAAATVALAEAV